MLKLSCSKSQITTHRNPLILHNWWIHPSLRNRFVPLSLFISFHSFDHVLRSEREKKAMSQRYMTVFGRRVCVYWMNEWESIYVIRITKEIISYNTAERSLSSSTRVLNSFPCNNSSSLGTRRGKFHIDLILSQIVVNRATMIKSIFFEEHQINSLWKWYFNSAQEKHLNLMLLP